MKEGKVRGKLKLRWKCPHCNKQHEDDVRLGSLDTSCRNEVFKWEGQCPKCFDWVEVTV